MTYTYLDPDHAYTDPETGILRNRENIADSRLLHVFESMKVGIRLEELQTSHVALRDASSLLDIHEHLFQDVYEWAGKTRTIEISKGGKPFFPLGHFPNAFAHIDTLIAQYRETDGGDKARLARVLAEIRAAEWVPVEDAARGFPEVEDGLRLLEDMEPGERRRKPHREGHKKNWLERPDSNLGARRPPACS